MKKFDNSLIRKKLDIYPDEAKPELKAAEIEEQYLSKPQIEKTIKEKRKSMETAAKELDFMQAAQLRDEIKLLQKKLAEID